LRDFDVPRRIGEKSEIHVDTFWWHFELAGLGNLHRRLGLVAGQRLAGLDLLYNIVALQNLAEDNMSAVEPPASSMSALTHKGVAEIWRKRANLTR
jgi:hypothetical protein